MPTAPRPSHVLSLATAVVALGLLLRWIGWPDAARSIELTALMLAAVAASLPAVQPAVRDWSELPASFVLVFASLTLFGPDATMLVASAAALTQGLCDPTRLHRVRRVLLNVGSLVISLQAAGAAYGLAGGAVGSFSWPWSALPVAAAVVVYCFTKALWHDLLIPLVRTRALNRSWWRPLRHAVPVYVVGASVAIALAELIGRRAWPLLPVAAVPVYLVFRAYSASMKQLEQDHRHSELMDSLNQGVSIVDASGRITLWNDVLEQLLECPRDRALGHPLRAAVPALGETELPRVLDEVMANGTERTIPSLILRMPARPAGDAKAGDVVRVLQIALKPLTAGVALFWQDVTEQTRTIQALKRHGERLGLAAEIANDGLWEWDLRTRQFFVTRRWKAMIGLAAAAPITKAEDWLDRVHPDDIAALKETLQTLLSGTSESFQHEHRIRHEDGTYRSFQCRGVAPSQPGMRATRIAGSLTDLTDLTQAQERLRSAVFLDPLTGLCNRAVFVEVLGRRLQEFQRRHGGDRFALLYLDLDRFKVVNDSLGHLVGDELLIEVSRRLESCLRDGDVLARLGGDEFAILLNGLQTEQQANVVAFRVQETLSKPFSIGGREVFTSASIGIAFGLPQYTTPDEIMHDADTAMYQAKARGKARHEVFDADMDARARDRLGLESDLRRAVQNNDFEMHYQPIVSLASGMCIGFESLVRWNRNGKPVSPAMFIPIAEELGLIEPLGSWLLEQACLTFADWQRRFPDAGLECITVNVSSRQLVQQNFLAIVEQAIRRARLKPSALRIEITETALMTSPRAAAELLSHLQEFGAKIYLDDFGTGYSSLSHLHKLPVDALKIDRSFVRSLLLPDRPAIVESILALARTLNTSVVAEGVETEIQARELERLGCTHAQGYLFSRPLSVQAAEEMLGARRPLGPKGAVDPALTIVRSGAA